MLNLVTLLLLFWFNGQMSLPANQERYVFVLF